MTTGGKAGDTPSAYESSRKMSLDVRMSDGDTATTPIIRTGPDRRFALLASRCDACGDVRYPPRELCPMDRSPATAFALAGTGSIYEAVEVHLAPVGFVAPYWVGYVDMDEGVRVLAQIRDDTGRQPHHGDRVDVHFETIGSDDHAAIGPVFRPCQE